MIAAGDTKVVERGGADGLFVVTAGLGVVPDGVEFGPERARPGDRVLLSGTLGDHGMAVMVARGGLALEVDLHSDTAPVHELAAALLDAGGVRWMCDPTRGGLATALNELARSAGLTVLLSEEALPVREEVRAACEILGIDPLYVPSAYWIAVRPGTAGAGRHPPVRARGGAPRVPAAVAAEFRSPHPPGCGL